MDRQHRIERQSAIVRRQAEGGTAEATEAHPLLRLQRQVGNSQIARLLAQRKNDDDQQNERDTAEQTDAAETATQASNQAAASGEYQGPDVAEPNEPAELEAPGPEAPEVGGDHTPAAETKPPLEDEGPKPGETKPAEQTEEEKKEIAAMRLQRESVEEEELQASRLQRESLEEEELQTLRLQRQSEPEVGLEGGPVSQQFANRLGAQRGGGAPLASDTRQTMEGAFGTSFGDVRVHSGGEAAALSRAISAKAFTTGNDIFLGESASAGDTQLMAHELTHVVQQRNLSGGDGLRVSPAGDAHEQEAEAAAATVTTGGQLAGGTAQRRSEHHE